MLDAMSVGSCSLICRLCCHGPWHWLTVCWFGLCCLCQCLYSSKVWAVASKFAVQSWGRGPGDLFCLLELQL